jgi:hypothetical protein
MNGAIPPSRSDVLNLAVGLWSLRNKSNNTSSAAAAAIELSPAFQSRESSRIVVLVAAATVDTELQNQPSLRRLRTDMR